MFVPEAPRKLAGGASHRLIANVNPALKGRRNPPVVILRPFGARVVYTT